MAVSFAQPTDVVKVRFQAQMNLNSVARRYNGTMQAYKHIYQNEGFRGLWKGAGTGASLTPALPKHAHTWVTVVFWVFFFKPGTLPNITRNALVNCTELVTYDMIKEAILKHKLMSGLTHTHTHTSLKF